MKLLTAVFILILNVISVYPQQNYYSFDENSLTDKSETFESNKYPASQNNNYGSGINWSKDFTAPGIIGTIYATATDGTSLFVGGLFNSAGNTIANSIAKWDGQKWSSIGDGIENGVNQRYSSDVPSVEAMVYAEGKLFVGGQFPKAGSLEANGIAFWDGTKWNRLDGGSTNGLQRYLVINGDTTIVGGFVYSLFAHKNKIYIGGYFHLAGGKPANGIAAWDMNTGEWETFNGGLSSNLDSDPVYAYSFAGNGNDIYVGGKFSYAGGVPAKNIAKWNGTDWSSFGNAEGYVYELKFDSQNNLYAVGYFYSNENTGSCGVGIWDGTNWKPLAGPEGFNSQVRHINFLNDELYAGGSFENAETQPANILAKWDGSTWHFIKGLGISSNEFLSGSVRNIEFLNGKLYISGDFTKAGNLFVNNIVEWDYINSRWKKLDEGSLYKGIHDGYISSMSQSGGSIYAGGSFSVAGGVYARNIAKWNGINWESLGTDYNNGIRGSVYTVLVDGNDVYVGGYFGSAGTVEAYHIAKWDGTNWSSIGIGVGGVRGAYVRALAKLGDYLYVGGYFSIVGDDENYALPANSIARFNLITKRWDTLGNGIEYNHGIPGKVFGMDLNDNKIYVGGEFYLANSESFLNFIVIENNKWTGIGDNKNIGIEGHVRTVKVIDGEIYIGGILQLERFGESSGILKWDKDKWIPVGEKLTAGDELVFVNDIQPYNNGLIAGGYFQKAGSAETNNIAYYDGNKWNELSSGINPGVSQIALLNNKIYTSGPREMFSGGVLSLGLAQYDFNITSMKDDEPIINEFSLNQNYPNPFNPETVISFHLPSAGHVTLKVFDILGREITTLVDSYKNAGMHHAVFNGHNTADNKQLTSGIYIYSLQADGIAHSKKMILLK